MQENRNFIIVKAGEGGATVTGVTRGKENKFLHTEKLEAGEVWVAEFTDNISAMKIKGNAEIQTALGKITSGI